MGRNVAKLASPPSQPQREQHPPSVNELQKLLVAAMAMTGRNSRANIADDRSYSADSVGYWFVVR